jgi:hypothetical protein
MLKASRSLGNMAEDAAAADRKALKTKPQRLSSTLNFGIRVEFTSRGVLKLTKVSEQILNRTPQCRALWHFVSGHRGGEGGGNGKGLAGLRTCWIECLRASESGVATCVRVTGVKAFTVGRDWNAMGVIIYNNSK